MFLNLREDSWMAVHIIQMKRLLKQVEDRDKYFQEALKRDVWHRVSVLNWETMKVSNKNKMVNHRCEIVYHKMEILRSHGKGIHKFLWLWILGKMCLLHLYVSDHRQKTWLSYKEKRWIVTDLATCCAMFSQLAF